ncbi:hypothetical protein M885DRAFT_531005 [Pelagophyceae sp. CCMP2097]|nr:hypothetical protein M885DRAFT_531005 [Pelagophyceae sp. CCMP2097]
MRRRAGREREARHESLGRWRRTREERSRGGERGCAVDPLVAEERGGAVRGAGLGDGARGRLDGPDAVDGRHRDGAGVAFDDGIRGPRGRGEVRQGRLDADEAHLGDAGEVHGAGHADLRRALAQRRRRAREQRRREDREHGHGACGYRRQG